MRLAALPLSKPQLKQSPSHSQAQFEQATLHSSTKLTQSNAAFAVLQGVYADFVQLFAELPLAALVESNTLILHGGLFRVPPPTEPGQKPEYKNTKELPKRMLSQLRTGSLEDLRNYKTTRTADKKSSKARRKTEGEVWYKGGVDPDPPGKSSAHYKLCVTSVTCSASSTSPVFVCATHTWSLRVLLSLHVVHFAAHMCQLIASDILWSDPSYLPGHIENDLRGVGTRFGPDVTEVRPAAGSQHSNALWGVAVNLLVSAALPAAKGLLYLV
jgi:hypothetical protein